MSPVCGYISPFLARKGDGGMVETPVWNERRAEKSLAALGMTEPALGMTGESSERQWRDVRASPFYGCRAVPCYWPFPHSPAWMLSMMSFITS